MDAAFRRLPVAIGLAVLAGAAAGLSSAHPAPSPDPGALSHAAAYNVHGELQGSLAPVIPNDNRHPAGRVADGALDFLLVARLAAWRPDLDVDSAVTVQAFAAEDGVPRIPGPLLRVEEGTLVRATIVNEVPDSVLVISGLRAGTVADDTLHVAAGGRREITFRAGAPGTYLYWGSTSGAPAVAQRSGRDSQLTGAIVVDAAGVAPDPAERIFVMTVIDVVTDSAAPPPHEDIWELAINGLSWPHSERLEHHVGDTIRWRWLNGTYLPHPMHLHGFHFRVLAKGTGVADTHFAPGAVREVVTEFMPPGSTFRMEWTPTRGGNWLFHCHMAPHITPYPERADSLRAHDAHDVAQHALYGMAGLVLGIRVKDRAAGPEVPPEPQHRLRLFVQKAPGGPGPRAAGYVLQQGAEPAADSVVVPGAPLVLTRGETTAITVINRTDELTTVHWHGMELESVYDGVAGWSGAESNLAPLIAPGDSFIVAFTPPRAGTYIYHTHMDESLQLGSGMYGAIIVLEPGQRYDPATDLLVIAGRAVDGGKDRQAINGRHDPAAMTLAAGTTYRFRLINILPAAPVEVELRTSDGLSRWRAIAKDGADLPPALRVDGPSMIRRMGVGETYDFEWTPAGSFDGSLVMRINPPAPDSITMRLPLRVR